VCCFSHHPEGNDSVIYEPHLPGSAKNVASLEDYVEAVRKRWLWVAICALAGLALAVLYTRSTEDSFESTARVLVAPTPVGAIDARLVAPNLDRESAILGSDAIGTAAVAQVGPGLPFTVSTSFVPASDVILISVVSPSAKQASDYANAYATAYVTQRVADQGTFYASSDEAVSAEIAGLEVTIAATQLELAALDQSRQDVLSVTPNDDDEARLRNAEIERIAADRSVANGKLVSDQARKRTLDQDLIDLRREQKTQKPAAAVIGVAEPADGRMGVGDRAFWLIGLILGLILGVVIAFLRERFDRSVQVARDVELALGGRVIGGIPKFGWRARRGQWALVMATGRNTPAIQRAREAYRRLRSSVQYLAKASSVEVIVVTSNRPAEGKSTTAANLAISLALGGSNTVLISADMRRSTLEHAFGMANDRGLSTYLGGSTENIRLESISGVGNLAVIPSGPEPANPGELLASSRFASLLDHLRGRFDLIIVDTPPLGAAADSIAAAAQSDGVIVVVDGSKTDTVDLLEMRNELERSGLRLLGAVLNRDSSQPKGIFGRKSRYGYYTTESSATPAPLTLGRKNEVVDVPVAEDLDDDLVEMDDYLTEVDAEVESEVATKRRRAARR
jgi:capsular exopolysaccharide synthesis family protein